MLLKYDEYALDYAQQVNQIKRQWDTFEAEKTDLPFRVFRDRLSEYSLETCLIYYKLWSNFHWAKAKGNKHLMTEDLDGFPYMNYLLREGPYTPPLDAQFGTEDFHLILQGDHGNLVFLQPRLYGLNQGYYVETDL